MNSELIQNPAIAIVFATMNRSATAVACLESLAAQTRPPELVIVADNVSSDDTVEKLSSIGNLPFELIVLNMDENLGNAGGVEKAMELAFSRKIDAVWILDDDSWPRSDALEAMLSEPLDTSLVLHPIQLDPRTGNFTWPLQVLIDDSFRLVNSIEKMPDGERSISRGVWTGALVSRHVRDTIGPVLGELFIRGEDEEYPWRMEKAGFKHMAVHAAIMDHPGPTNIVHWKLFGKNFFFEKDLADWKLYYKVRNMVWLKKKQSGAPKALLTYCAYVFAAFRFDKVLRLRLLGQAFADGWSGKLGKWKRGTTDGRR